MSNFKKYSIIILCFITFIFVLLYFIGYIRSPIKLKSQDIPPSPTLTLEKTENLIILVVDFGDGKTIEYQKETLPVNIVTALSLLEEASQNTNFKLTTKKYDFGTFVQSIDDYQGSSEKAWIFFVNGQSGQVASDRYELKPGDIVEWKYVIPNGE